MSYYNRHGYTSAKCKFIRWSKVSGHWISECKNKNCIYYGEECIEKQGDDSEPCDEKEEADD